MHFINKKIDHVYNKCEFYFLLKNKLFKHLRSLYSKQNSIKDLLKIIFNKFAFMINNAYIDIIKFTTKSHHDIKSNYNFKN